MTFPAGRLREKAQVMLSIHLCRMLRISLAIAAGQCGGGFPGDISGRKSELHIETSPRPQHIHHRTGEKQIFHQFRFAARRIDFMDRNTALDASCIIERSGSGDGQSKIFQGDDKRFAFQVGQAQQRFFNINIAKFADRRGRFLIDELVQAFAYLQSRVRQLRLDDFAVDRFSG